MATGTSPITGTIRTGMTGLRPPPQRPPLLAKVTQWWTGLTQRQKMLVAAIAVAAILVFGVSFRIQKASAYVNLYENALSTEDINDVTMALAQVHVPYGKTIDNHITVPPGKRVEALAALMNQGIPRHPFFQPTTGSSTQTHEEFTEQQHRLLERDITMVLRQFNEIADANVKLVIPSENDSFFRDEKDEAKAAVVIKLRQGYDSLPLEKTKALVNFVASSVPKLKPENVQLTDTNGRLFSDMLKESQSSFSSEKMIDQKLKFQKQLEAQIRQILDKALGPEKYALAVNVDLDWNKAQSITQGFGSDLNAPGAIVEQVQEDTEKFMKGNSKSGGAKQIAYSDGQSNGTNGKGGDYERGHVLKKFKVNSKETRVDVTPGQIKQITASVLTEEQLNADNKDALRAAVKNAIGYNYDRGDSVSFGMLPFHRDELAEMRRAMESPAIFRHDGGGLSSLAGTMALRVTMAALLLGIVGIAVYLYREQKARIEKTELVLAAGPTANISDISDLLSEKTGKVIPSASSSGVRETRDLEQLVKEKPTKVAELLKTTWLAEK